MTEDTSGAIVSGAKRLFARARRFGLPSMVAKSPKAQRFFILLQTTAKESMTENAPDRQKNTTEQDLSAVRLNKALAAAGVCSRRKADALITQGQVTVNGNVVTELGLRIRPDRDVVSVRGRPVAIVSQQKQTHHYVALYKPIQVVSTASDPEGRQTVLDLLPPQYKNKRLYPVGRLDYFSEGLILLTDDGELTHRLTHPRYHLPKVYEVSLREMPTPDMVRRMRSGMTLAEGERLAPVEVFILPEQPGVLRLTLRQGVNRQIRRMCRDLDLTILKLVRLSVGPLHLRGLAPGQCRELSPDERAGIKKAAGL